MGSFTRRYCDQLLYTLALTAIVCIDYWALKHILEEPKCSCAAIYDARDIYIPASPPAIRSIDENKTSDRNEK